MPVSIPPAPTVGEIARRLGVAIHRVSYIVRSRDVHPTARAGNARVFSEDDITFIAGELRRIDEEREGIE